MILRRSRPVITELPVVVIVGPRSFTVCGVTKFMIVRSEYWYMTSTESHAQ
jgi:hypothetical protein